MSIKARRMLPHSSNREVTMTSIKQPFVDVVIPIHKESNELINTSLNRLDSYLKELSVKLDFQYKITVACSACSKDTQKNIQKLKKSIKNLREVRETEPGRGRILKSAWSSSASEIVMYTDVDLATSTDSIEGLLTPLINGYRGIVYGDRRLGDSNTKRSLFRRILSLLYQAFIKFFIGSKAADMQCGFKAMPTDIAKELIPKIKDNFWHFDSELLIYAQRNDIDIIPVGVQWKESKSSSIKYLRTAYASLSFINSESKKQNRSLTPERLLFVLIALVGAIWYFYNLTNNKWANVYYSSATQSAMSGWKQFFFGSFDNLNFISIDKYPMVVWPSVLSAKIFGFNSFAIMLPHALAGLISAMLLYMLVRKEFGIIAALVTWILFVLSPLGAIMFRFNNPDTYLMLFSIIFLYCVINIFETNKLLFYVLGSLSLGICFQLKTIQSLLFVVPVVAVLYWEIKTRDINKVIKNSVIGLCVFLVTALWWPVIVSLTNPSKRPIVGGSSTNSVWDLITGYNGISRLTGQGSAQVTGQTSAVFGGPSGIFRMFNTSFFSNIGWLLLPTLIFSIYLVWYVFRNNNQEQHSQKRLLLFLAVTLLTHIVVLSFARGKIHAYYSLALVPYLCALVAISVVIVYRRIDSSNFKILLWMCAASTFSVIFIIPFALRRIDSNWNQKLFIPLLTVGVVLVASFIYMSLLQKYEVVRVVYYLSICVAVTVSVFSTLDTMRTSYFGYLPTAKPKDAIFSKVPPLPEPDQILFEKLEKKVSNKDWLAASENSFDAAIVQLSTGRAVMAFGGFDGIDFVSSPEQRDKYIQEGRVKFFVSSRRIAPKFEISNIRRWVFENSKECPHDSQWYLYALGENACPV